MSEEEFIRSADGKETVTDDKEATILNLIREANRLHDEIAHLRTTIRDCRALIKELRK